MSLKNELKDLVLEVLAFVITGLVAIALLIYTDLGVWPVVLIGTAVGIGVVMLIRRQRNA